MGIDEIVFDDSEMIPLFPIDGDDGFVDEPDFRDVSGNDFDVSIMSDKMDSISKQLDDIIELQNPSPTSLSVDRVLPVDKLDAYYVRYNGEYVYIPLDRVQYLVQTANNEIVNISASTINAYSLDRNGNVLNQYRFQPFSKPQEYVYGYDGQQYQHWYWTNISIASDSGNLVYGQTGINNFTDFILFGILFFVGIIAIFRRNK